jgi:RNA methyltransferase, TrmH family
MPNAEVVRHPWTSAESALDEIDKLQTSRPHRDRERLFYAEGVRNLLHLCEAGAEVVALVRSEPLLKNACVARSLRALKRAGVPCFDVTPEAFRRVSRAEHASGAGAVVRQRWATLHRLPPRRGLCWIALERVRSPGNFGSLVRTSEAVGAAGFILLGGQVDPFDPSVVRASMGAFWRQSFVRTGARQLGDWIARHRCDAVGASPDGEHEYQRYRFRQPTIIVLGEERRGLSEAQRELCSTLVRIPMQGEADSLNLAVAGSLLLYEVYRATR